MGVGLEWPGSIHTHLCVGSGHKWHSTRGPLEPKAPGAASAVLCPLLPDEGLLCKSEHQNWFCSALWGAD